MATDLLDRLLPAGALVLGAFLTKLNQSSDRRAGARIEAGDLLADHTRRIWDKGQEGSYLDLLVYLGRLRGRLRSAGVPLQLVTRLDIELVGFWRGLSDSESPDVGYYSSAEQAARVIEAVEVVQVHLDHPYRPIKRWLARRDAGAFFAGNPESSTPEPVHSDN